ncbi:MAG: hypothetical protein HY695_25910 [Deltaproteobacteria bacterium]|nr:hypothetical protein [Deltaproteobacteria bacterium]
MKNLAVLLVFLILSGCLAVSAEKMPSTEPILFKVAAPEGNYCHLKFPAIQEETLFTNHPVLKDPGSGDLVDFYGPCDHDPLGKEEIKAQRADVLRERRRGAGDE